MLGRWLGSLQIAAIVTVGAVIMLFSSAGIVVGAGGASIISRALGEKNRERISNTFGNQLLIVAISSISLCVIGFAFEKHILKAFGAYGDIFPYASLYYRVLLVGIPFFTFSMMGNMVIQSVGKAKVALTNSLIPTLLNGFLNPFFIKGLNMGIAGSAWATFVSMVLGFILVFFFFYRGKLGVNFGPGWLRYNAKLASEIIKIGSSVLVGVIASNGFMILLNKILYKYEGESGIIIYSIINRVSMLFLIPVVGIDGGIRPIIGYNFGSGRVDRIRKTVLLAMKYGMLTCCFLLFIIIVFSEDIIGIITSDDHVIQMTPYSMKIVFAMSPLYMFDVVSVAYFQSVGKAGVALFITMLRNVILLIPIINILPYYFGYNGILYSFPIVDILTTIPVFIILRTEMNRHYMKLII